MVAVFAPVVAAPTFAAHAALTAFAAHAALAAVATLAAVAALAAVASLTALAATFTPTWVIPATSATPEKLTARTRIARLTKMLQVSRMVPIRSPAFKDDNHEDSCNHACTVAQSRKFGTS